MHEHRTESSKSLVRERIGLRPRSHIPLNQRRTGKTTLATWEILGLCGGGGVINTQCKEQKSPIPREGARVGPLWLSITWIILPEQVSMRQKS